jgi:hypothetical protein
MIFLPGLDAETAEYAAKRVGRTTALQDRVVDASGMTSGQEGMMETGRDLIDAAELRQMPQHTQAVAIFGSLPPIKFGFPPFAKVGPESHARAHDLRTPVLLAEAEAALAMRRAGASDDGVSASAEVAPPRSSSGEIKFDLDDYLARAGGSIDSLIQSMLGSAPSPVVEVEASTAAASGAGDGGRQ